MCRAYTPGVLTALTILVVAIGLVLMAMHPLLGLILALAVALPACTKETPRPVMPEAPKRPHVTGMVEIQPGDGRVYVIKSPDQFGIESATCFLHVGPAGSSAMACTASRIDLTDAP